MSTSFSIKKNILFLFLMCCGRLLSQEIGVYPVSFSGSGSSDIGPVFMDSTLIFSSNRKSNVVISYVDENKEPLYSLFKSDLLVNGNWTRPVPFASEIASKFTNGTVSITKDGQTLYCTQNFIDDYKSRKKGKRGNMIGVFQSQLLSSGKWGRVEALSFNSKRKYSTGQPAVSADGKMLFFVSDMDGGFGGSDIYYSEKKDGAWGPAKNLGDVVNTDGNEVFPYMHDSGKLYFASNGHGGQGGLDLFYSIYTGNWSAPMALEVPINSAADDYACCILEEEDQGYFCSNRNGSDDIFSFKVLFPAFEGCEEQTPDNFCFTFFENGPFESDTLPYIYKWSFGDGTTARGLEVDHCFKGAGVYDVDLAVVDTLANVDLFTVASYQLPLEKKVQVFIVCPEKIKVGDEVVFDASSSNFGRFEPGEFYWNLGDGTKTKGTSVTHTYTKAGSYSVTCGVVSAEKRSHKMCSSHSILVVD